jgi:putative transposase
VLTDDEFETWHRGLGLPRESVALIEQIRSSDPARRVGGGSRNVWGRYPSDKMGCTIQFESHTVELPAIYLKEHDPYVLEFYDQPNSIVLAYKSASGRPVGPVTTPDFFVLWRDCAGWEEWKTEAALLALADKSPNRWILDAEGWHSPPGDAFAHPLGLVYRVCSENQINPVVVRNLRFLEDVLRDPSDVDETIAALLLGVVSGDPGITIADLIGRVRALLVRGQA